METEASLVAAANRNFLGSFRKLAEHIPGASVRDFGGIFAFQTGLPINLFNGCVVHRPSSTDDLAEALDWIASTGHPYLLWLHEELTDQFGPVGTSRGLEQEDWLTPQMVLRSPSDSPRPPPGVAVRSVTDAASLDEFVAVLAGGSPSDVARRMIPAVFAEDPDVACLTAYLGEQPVGTAIAIRTDDVSGVYAVGTLPEARRRGVGTAATWAAVETGRAWGCETIVLQSTAMGFPVYAAMGFTTVVRYAVFRPAD